MIEPFSSILPNRLAVLCPSIEHQESGRGSVGSEHGEHIPLICSREKEKTIPAENPIKASLKRDGPHIRHDPLPLLSGH